MPSLPDDVWREAWSYLTIEDCVRAERTARAWRHGMAYESRWRALTRTPLTRGTSARDMWTRLLHPRPCCLLCGASSLVPFVQVQCGCCTAPMVQHFRLGCCVAHMSDHLEFTAQPGWLVLMRCYLCRRRCVGLCRWELLTAPRADGTGT